MPSNRARASRIAGQRRCPAAPARRASPVLSNRARASRIAGQRRCPAAPARRAPPVPSNQAPASRIQGRRRCPVGRPAAQADPGQAFSIRWRKTTKGGTEKGMPPMLRPIPCASLCPLVEGCRLDRPDAKCTSFGVRIASARQTGEVMEASGSRGARESGTRGEQRTLY